MARLACCLVLICLCLSIVLEPALAAKKGHKSPKAPKVTFANYLAPAAAPFPSAVPTEQTLIKQLCQDTRKPRLCAKIVQGDKNAELTMNPITKAKISLDIATSIASRVGAYMSNQLKRNHVKVHSRGFVEGCSLDYENAVVALNLSYINFENNPKKAIESLKEAENKVGICINSLKLGGPHADIPPVLEANKVIQSLIKVAQSVAQRRAH